MTCLRAITMRRATTRWRRRGSAATGRAYLLHSVIFVIAAFAVPAIAGADTVYLKNGRVIHTARTRVENGMLVFSQLGGTVSIPMSAVERVERNTAVEPAPAAPPESAAAAGKRNLRSMSGHACGPQRVAKGDGVSANDDRYQHRGGCETGDLDAAPRRVERSASFRSRRRIGDLLAPVHGRQ